MKNNLIKIFIALFVLIVIFCIYYYNKNIKNKRYKNKQFYDINEICPYLINISLYSNSIKNEIIDVDLGKWNTWPEKHLFNGSFDESTWKVYPFYAFGIWVKQNCEQCPKTYEFLKKVPGLKLATFSKLTKGMRLKPHCGWGSHSNYVIRCHYGIIVPTSCYVVVENIKQYHKQNDWLAFDDSKEHYAVNQSDSDRIILILDIERPSNIKIGTSDVTDTTELLELVNHFKKL
jgi:beta-hydroxylase